MKLTMLDEWIEACEEMKAAYEMDESPGGGCRLCDVAENEEDKIGDYLDPCLCPWVVFEKKECVPGDLEYPLMARVPRLERWIKRLKEMKEKDV